MKNRLMKVLPIILILSLALVFTPGCSEGAKTLVIYHAGSLAVPLQAMETAFESEHPNVDVIFESGGSAAVISTAITEIEAGESGPDIIASADYTLIPDRLYEGGYADWTIVFALNTMVLCYRDGAPFATDIESGDRTWYDVLRNENVKWGHSNPDLDPCGYRTLMVFQLAQEYYYDDAATFGNTPDDNADGLYDACIPGNDQERGRVGGDNEIVSDKSVDLLSGLDTGELDYAFEYISVAEQHELNYIDLDPAINLSQTGEIGSSGVSYANFYARASVQLEKSPGQYSTTTGAGIIYGITIMKDAPNADLAVEFIKLLLSETGIDIFEVQNGQPCVTPAKCDNKANVPSSLADLLVDM